MGESSSPTGARVIRVLLVDDEQDLLVTGKMILEKKIGFLVETSPSVDAVFRLLAEKSFDVIVSDYLMDGKSGLQLLKALRGRGDTTPFILFTGRGREEVAIEASENRTGRSQLTFHERLQQGVPAAGRYPGTGRDPEGSGLRVRAVVSVAVTRERGSPPAVRYRRDQFPDRYGAGGVPAGRRRPT